MRSPLQDWLSRPEHELHDGVTCSWSPATDVIETRDAYVVFVELPGMARDEFVVEAAADSLTLRGVRYTRETCCDAYLRLERSEGAFHRTFTFQDPIDPGAVAASYEDGVLRLDLPKAGMAGSRKIEIG
jgi:HSP20 family protein